MWAGASNCYLDMSYKLQKQVYSVVPPTLAASLESFTLRQNVLSLCVLYRYYFNKCLSELAELVSFCYSRWRSTRYCSKTPYCNDCTIFLPRFCKRYKGAFINNAFYRTARFLNSLSAECFL